MKGMVTAIEAHSGITGLIAEKTVVYQNGEAHQFDAMWVSSLCDSTSKGKPDIELVDMTSRFRTIDDILDVTTKPIIFDGGHRRADGTFHLHRPDAGAHGRLHGHHRG